MAGRWWVVFWRGRCMRGRLCCAARAFSRCAFGRPRGSETRFVFCSVPPPRAARSAGPPRLDAAPPRGWLLRCSIPRLGLQITDNVCVVQRPPFSRCALGRTPATNVAPPRGWLLRCSIPRLGSLFAAQDQRRHEREPQKPRKRLITDPLRGARRLAAGVRPSASEKGGRCITRTPSTSRTPEANLPEVFDRSS